MLGMSIADDVAFCLSPHGESGLKFDCIHVYLRRFESLPTRGEWVEMRVAKPIREQATSLPTRGEWVEISQENYYIDLLAASLPTRGEWVEMPSMRCVRHLSYVSPHTGRVG